MDPQHEQMVAQGLRTGSAEAWRALYDAFARRIWQSIARQMGGNPADVADVVQETFLAAARSARGFDPARGSLWLWLSGIARNHVAIYYRKRQRDRRQGDGHGPADEPACRQPSAEAALASAELAQDLRAALTALPVDYETLLTARYLDEVSVEQIALADACSVAAVRSKLARARKALREVLVARNPLPKGEGELEVTP